MRTTLALGLGGLAVALAARPAAADTTPQPLPFSQDWTNTGLITTNNDWSGVPGITGYTDDVAGTGVIDPSAVLVDRNATVQVFANRTDPSTFSTGGIAEFEIANPVVGFQGSGSADSPNLVVFLDTTGVANVRVQFDAIDIDSGADSVQPVATQFRVGSTGNYTNLAAGFIADASDTGATTGKTTHVNVVLPAGAGNQTLVEVRIMTGNATGTDEFIGIDNISITDASTPPTATGASTPTHQVDGGDVVLTATTSPGTFPTSVSLSVLCNLAGIGGATTQAFFDDGSHGDTTAGDGIFTFTATLGATATAGLKNLGCVVTDDQARHSNFSIAVTVDPVCGDGRVEGSEACDDGRNDDGDGCSATCTIESGWSCSGSPSVCTDNNECQLGTDTCDPNASCTNIPGSFTCACNPGWSGDGFTCTNIDECAASTDDCVALATCNDTPGSFTCTCASGYGGDGRASGTGCTNLDECTLGTDNCDVNATCADTDGSFTCTCNTGYSGSGVTCTDVDECAAQTDNCDANATCTNTPGSFTCSCNSGYSGDGITCSDVDECAAQTDNCDANATCTNTAGSFTCACNTGFSGSGVTCAPVCGDGMVVSGEGCDDGGTEAADGCSATCAVESGWSCTGAPSTCTPICGDGMVVGTEGCDDGGTTAGDGCDATCQMETGYDCTGMPSVCTLGPRCGDGHVDTGEQCDDGNTTSGDGCDAGCSTETGYVCDGASPTVCAKDSDGDGVPDNVDNCPDVSNADQADSDQNGTGDACDTASGGGGCCSTGGDAPLGGPLLLTLFAFAAVRTRRR